MAQETFDQAMRLGLDHHRAGRFGEAERIYREIIQQNPHHGHALHMLGVLARQTGRANEAVNLFEQTIRILPPSPEIFVNFGGALLDEKKFDEAIAAFSKAVELRPHFPEAHCGLGAAQLGRARSEAAIAACHRAIELRPAYAEAYHFLGSALRASGRLDESIAAYTKAVENASNFAAAFQNLGIALREKGRLAESIAALRRATQLRPDHADGHNHLGASLAAAGEWGEAIGAFERALHLRPDFIEALNNLGMALRRTQRLDDASAVLARAIELTPTCAPCLVNLGNVCKDKGNIDRALACFRKAAEVDPGFELAQSNICYAVHFDPAYTPAMILAEHRHWAHRFAEPLTALARPHDHDRSTNRRLKIGFVSPDLRFHGVGRFLLPLLQNHDKSRFEIHCYSDVRRPDAMTGQLRNCCDGWHETAEFSDDALAEQVRHQKIDLLIDLTLHMEGSRLLTFARKPAPIQVTWLGYPGTTGLSAMDYRLSDSVLDPPEVGNEIYAEKTHRIPSYWCYAPVEPTPAVTALPALGAGYITFGCFNDFSKTNIFVFELWAKILQRVHDAKLLLHALPGSHRQYVLDFFSRAGIEPTRINFVKRMPLSEYFHQYNHIDIALDTTPYGGGTTTCDALWMGVPVVTLTGKTAVGRGTAGLLSQIGLESLIAETPEGYVNIAVQLASNLQHLADLRTSMRQRMRASPLMDAPRFARSIESAVTQMWDCWQQT